MDLSSEYNHGIVHEIFPRGRECKRCFRGMILNYVHLFIGVSHEYVDIEFVVAAQRPVKKSRIPVGLGFEHEDAELLTTAAKVKMSQVAQLAAQEGIQFHGGVGMTDEYDIGLYLKRIRAAQELFGDAHYHMDAIAKMKGF